MKTKPSLVEKIPVKALFVPMRCPVCNGFGTLKFGTLDEVKAKAEQDMTELDHMASQQGL